MASASSEHDAGEAPAKKPWSRPTFYRLTDVIESHGNPTAKSHTIYGFAASENETGPTTTPFQKNYRPASA